MNSNNEEPLSVAETLEISGGYRRRKWIKWIIVAIVLLSGGLAGALAFKKTTSPASAHYKTTEVQRGDLTVTVSATGNLEPTNQVDVGSELSGIIESVLVEENDRVKVHQVLACLDTSKLKAKRSQNKAELASARAKVLQAEATTREAKNNLARLRHVRKLSNNKVPSSYDMDAAEAALSRARADDKSARAAVAQVQATLESTETDLEKSIIRSPMNGVVLDRKVEPGQTVAATMTAPVLFTLAEDLAQMELSVDVDEADVGQVKAGQKATFSVDAYPDRQFRADITRVSYGSDTTDGVVTYETLLKVNNQDQSLRPGMTATADIIVENLENVILIPNAALRFQPSMRKDGKPDGPPRKSLINSLLPGPPKDLKNKEHEQFFPPGNGWPIWILQDGQPRPVFIRVGVSDGVNTEVLGDVLSPGMQVILEQQKNEKR